MFVKCVSLTPYSTWKRKNKMKPYNNEEQKLIKAIENEDWVSVDNVEEEIRKAREAARATMLKTERMNIRISPRDLNGLKTRALEEGIPYQTLVSSILHKYISGNLISREN